MFNWILIQIMNKSHSSFTSTFWLDPYDISIKVFNKQTYFQQHMWSQLKAANMHIIIWQWKHWSFKMCVNSNKNLDQFFFKTKTRKHTCFYSHTGFNECLQIRPDNQRPFQKITHSACMMLHYQRTICLHFMWLCPRLLTVSAKDGLDKNHNEIDNSSKFMNTN